MPKETPPPPGHQPDTYDVGKLGVMLAHTYRYPGNGKVRRPPRGASQAPVGWWMSEKFDGFRAVWDGKVFRSRANNVFVVPQWFAAWLPRGVPLDGELFIARGAFQQCGIFKKLKPDDAEWRRAKVTYRIFDMPALRAKESLFSERHALIKGIVRDACARGLKGRCPLKVVRQQRVRSEGHMREFYDKVIAGGGEGVMLRCPDSVYEGKRSACLLKVKPKFDAECRIIGFKAGKGANSGRLGAFHCETLKAPRVRFHVSGMCDAIRDSYTTTHPLGTVVTFSYAGLSQGGIPRHPVYERLHVA